MNLPGKVSTHMTDEVEDTIHSAGTVIINAAPYFPNLNQIDFLTLQSLFEEECR